MGKKFAFIVGYFISSLAILSVLTLVLLSSLFTSNESHKSQILGSNSQKPKYQTLPNDTYSFSAKPSIEDGRVDALKKFFSEYESPLLPHSQLLVEKADEYGLDYRLIPAIAMKESTLCHKSPKHSHNCWGYGVYGGKTTYFTDYETAINTVSKGLGERYIGIGLVDPIDIGMKYNPVSNGAWGEGVQYIMDRISIRL